MIEIRSSWFVDGHGRTRRLDSKSAPPDASEGNVYHCSQCGAHGHSRRTCGQTDERRRASQRGRPSPELVAAKQELRRRIAEREAKS